MEKIYTLGTITAIILFIVFVFEPFKPKNTPALSVPDKPSPTITTSLPSAADTIQVLHFHATQQCTSCINVGKFTKSVIEEKFPQEFKDGRIVFQSINIDLPENSELVEDYQVSGSALYLNVIKDGQDHHEQDTTVWRLVASESQLKNYFEAKLRQLL